MKKIYIFYKIVVIVCGKQCQNVKYIYRVKKDLFGCFRMEEIREKDNATSLKEGEGI